MKYHRKQNKRQQQVFTPRIFMVLGGVLVFMYVFQTNTIVELGYRYNELKAQSRRLAAGNQDLRGQISDAVTFDNLAGALAKLGLEEINSSRYLGLSKEATEVLARADNFESPVF